MNLFGLFQPHTEAVRQPPDVQTASGGRERQTAANLTPGQTIQGEIISKNGREVQIRVDRDVVISARLDSNVNVSEGQNITFEVKGNSDMQIALRPLFENLSQDANALKALEAAKLPASDEMVRMVTTMMEQGMSIDKNALQEMGRQVMANPSAAPETIVLLRSMQLSPTPENIQQFEQYKNYEHQILNTVTELLSQLPETFQSMVKGGEQNAAIDLYSQLLQLFSGTENIGQKLPERIVFSDTAIGNEAEAPLQKELISGRPDAVSDPAVKNGGEETGLLSGIKENPVLLAEALDTEERGQLLLHLRKLGLPDEQLTRVQDGTMETKELLQLIRQLTETDGEINGSTVISNSAFAAAHASGRENLAELFGSKAYNRLLNNEILQQWLLKPEEVFKKDTVEAFYKRLQEQTARLAENLNQALKDTPLAKNITSLQNNIDFMNQINQTFNYIQLPLKMSNGNTHGDLYVYTNRKSSLKEDGSVSALLHLDMEYMGTMDIHVSMHEKNVSTRFYLKEESMIDFLADHIHILNERLAKRGYSMTAEITVMEENHTNVIQNMTAEEKKESILSQYSFDARA